jgi:hypothetical protein
MIGIGGCRQMPGAACPSSLEDAQQRGVVGVQAAGLSWFLDRSESPEDIGWVFVNVDDKDFAELLSHLELGHGVNARYRSTRDRIAPMSQSKVDADDTYRHAITGEQGARVYVAAVEFLDAITARAHVGTSGGDTEVLLLCDESGWRVYDTGQGIAF